MALDILRAGEGETVERTGQPIFEGQVHGRTLVDGAQSDHIQSALVHFAAGARTRMHRHTSDQMLLVISGIGKVGDTDGDHVIAAGDSVLIPANTDHWHGAGDTGSPMTHLNVMKADSETTVL